jgi:hypothetical protein
LAALAALLLSMLALAACATPATRSNLTTRDQRSQSFCTLVARSSKGDAADTLTRCRYRERRAEMRARRMNVDGDLDRSCEAVATYGKPGGPFSWASYVNCIDDSI